MSVVGIDFGNQNCVISVARKGVVEIIVNEVSNRKTPSLIAFDGRERQLGEAAGVRMVSNATNTIDNIKRMLGRRFSDPDFQRDRKMFHFKTLPTNDDKIAIEVNYMDEQVQFAPEQIAAALFGCLKRITEKALTPISVQDCVITMPSYFTDIQRRALLDAAGLVGFNVLRLMHETTAVALQYGILRNLPEAAPFKVMFVDVGHSQTSASVVSFVQGKLTVLGSDSDPNLGGRDFDAAILRRFVDEIASKHNVDVTSNPKAMLRLAQVAERTKKMLSANNEAPWNVECLVNDLDVRGLVTRQELETTCTSLLERILVPVKNLMHSLNLKPADLHSMEIVGGTIRIPAVKTALESFFGRPCSTTCDGDESVARGAALMCAMLSPSFRVRDFDVQDVLSTGIEVAYGPIDGPLGDFTPLFPKFNAIPVTKMINFYRPETFKIEARYSEPVVGIEQFIGSFNISGIPQTEDANKPVKSKVKVRLDLNGIISVPGATSVQEIDEPEPTPAPAPDAMSVDEAPKPEVSGGDQTEPAFMEEEGSALPQPGPTAAEQQKMDVDTAPKKKQLKRTELQISSEIKGGLPSNLFQAYHEKEVHMHNEDKIIAETLEKRNDLESYIYEMRDRVATDLSEFLSESKRESFLEALDQAENWLYSEESEGAQKSTFVDQLNKLKAVGDVAVRLQSEYEQREQRIRETINLINSYKEFVESQDEKWAHISSEKKANVTAKCSELESWLSNVTAKQERLSKYEQPAFTVADLGTKCKELAQFVEPIMRTPKPKPTPSAAPEPAKEQKKAGEGEPSAMRDEENTPMNEAATKKESDSCEPTEQANESMNVD